MKTINGKIYIELEELLNAIDIATGDDGRIGDKVLNILKVMN